MNPKPTNPAHPKRPAELASSAPRPVKRGLLRDWPLPVPPPRSGKDGRGTVLVIGGAAEMPGAVILAATAALRAGAGRLLVATEESVAPFVATAIPEARVVGLHSRDGIIVPEAAEKLNTLVPLVTAVLLGPGMQDRERIGELLERMDFAGRAMVFDAEVLAALGRSLHVLVPLGQKVLTPHAGEMAAFLGIERAVVESAPLALCREAAARSGGVVMLKGAETWIAAGTGAAWLDRTGNVGLGTSGSGDVLAGLIAGLLARGASAEQAAVWASFIHGRAGELLADRVGPLGYLARELLDVIPGLLARP